MATELETLCSYITRQVILTDGALDNVVAAGINPHEWPDRLKCKEIFIEFQANVETKNFQYAVWNATKKLHIEVLENIFGNITFPSDQKVIKLEYEKLLARERAEQLSVQIANNPEAVNKFIDEFLSQASSSVDVVTFEEALDEFVESNKAKKAKNELEIMIPGWEMLSRSIGGWNPGRLGILIADTGFGKTNLGIQLSLCAAKNLPTLYYNMEMIGDDFTQRLISSMLSMKPRDFYGEWNTERARLHVKERKLFLTKGKTLSLNEIRSVARKYKKEQDIKFIIVDYDQKIALGASRDEEWKLLQKAAEGLEELAKELQCYVLLLAQSNLDGGISGSKRSTFPATNVFMFEKVEEDTIIRLTKNRFGKRNAAVKVDYEPETATVIEKDMYVWVEKKKKDGFKKSSDKT